MDQTGFDFPMIKVRQSFDELRKGDQIRVKGWQYAPEIVEKLADERLLVAGNGPMANISYDQYDYSLVEDWPYGQGVRFVAIRLPIEKLSLDMHIATKGDHGSFPFVCRVGDEITLHDALRDRDLRYSYEHDYNYSLLRVSEAAELVEDPLEQLAFRILARDPMALDAGKDVLRC